MVLLRANYYEGLKGLIPRLQLNETAFTTILLCQFDAFVIFNQKKNLGQDIRNLLDDKKWIILKWSRNQLKNKLAVKVLLTKQFIMF